MNRILIVAALVISASTISFSQDAKEGIKARLLIDAGLEYGGDEIATIFFTNGDDQKMLAGQGGYIAAGGQFFHSGFDKLFLRTSIGIKYNTTAADNANIRLLRYPFNFMGYFEVFDKARIGAGYTTHLGANLKGDGFFDDADFNSSNGLRFEIGYDWIALTYTMVDYIETGTNEIFSANSFGLSLSFLIPNSN